jgi:hypothetical protein
MECGGKRSATPLWIEQPNSHPDRGHRCGDGGARGNVAAQSAAQGGAEGLRVGLRLGERKKQRGGASKKWRSLLRIARKRLVGDE